MLSFRRHRLAALALIATVFITYQLLRVGSWDISALVPYGKDTAQPAYRPPPAPDRLKFNGQHTTRPSPPRQTTGQVRSEDFIAPSSRGTSTSAVAASSKKIKPTTTHNALLQQSHTPEEESVEVGSGRDDTILSYVGAETLHWKRPKTLFPIAPEERVALPKPSARKLDTIQASFKKESAVQRRDRLFKQVTVKETFLHAWNGYKTYAMGKDEVKPNSKESADPFMGWGATLVDSLDTLWIMGLVEEFDEAVAQVAKIDFTTSSRKDIPLFEVTIRYLGGLLGAYDVSRNQYPSLLQQARTLADILIGAFDTPNHMPLTFYNWSPSYTARPHRASAHVVLAELGTLSLEFTRLAQLTGNDTYYDAIARVTDALEQLQMKTLIPGLWPLKLDASGCKKPERESAVEGASRTSNSSKLRANSTPSEPDEVAGLRADTGHIEDGYQMTKRSAQKEQPPLRTMPQEVLGAECKPQGLAPEPSGKAQLFGIGGQADSTYEYLPKMHVLLRGGLNQYKRMYDNAAKAIREKLLFRPMTQDKADILFTAMHTLSRQAKDPRKREMTEYEVTHLGCFAGGMFALGSRIFDIPSDLETARKLTEGCVWAYNSMPSGIMAESAAVVPCMSLEGCAWNETRWHEALDPQREERSAALAAYNKKQKAIYDKAHKAASSAAQGSTASSIMDAASRKRDVTKDENLVSGRGAVDIPDDQAVSGTRTVEFVPKAAVSHEKYVQAQIREARLPPSYTKIFDSKYGLRPEALESVFYLYRITGDESWRDKGWEMFQAITRATHTNIAHSAIKDVTSLAGEQTDTMESFWLAETLKYAYLLFEVPDIISLDEWVLNTEAHPFRIPS